MESLLSVFRKQRTGVLRCLGDVGLHRVDELLRLGCASISLGPLHPAFQGCTSETRDEIGAQCESCPAA